MDEDADQSADAVTSEQYRDVAGHFASGVTVISTREGADLYGTTASAVSSLSLDPPMMLMCLNVSSVTHDAVMRAGVFGISILAAGQDHLAYHFGRRGPDKFASVPHRLGSGAVPVLDGALATVVCEVESTARGGTHTVFLGRVREAETSAREPLAYYRGKLGRLADSAERNAYEEVRSAILHRRTPLGEAIDVDALAGTVGAEPAQVRNALISLTGEDLVTRSDDGSLEPTPITAQVVADNYQARLRIEVGVLESQLATMSGEVKDKLVEIGDAIARVRAENPDGLEEYLQLNVDYHSVLVGSSGSEQLVASFRKLGIGTVWRQGLTGDEWAAELDNRHIAELTGAVLSGDLARAEGALRRHSDVASALAARVIGRAGGVV
ncbi:flavin reductase [Microbacterium sp.]|uniref:flavin reductase n=1 Tax=Microbacterium sp. TaxID=51671 RepID=UPI003A88927E